MLRIDSVQIENILGVENAEFAVGSLTVISGDNGTGKTSVLEAVRSVFDGGHDPSLIRNGADKGSVCITLSNGTTIKRVITQRASTLDIRTAEGLKIPKPAAFVEKLASGFAYDPLAFLEADDKKRQQFLLEAMPIQFLPAEVSAITGTVFPNPLGLEEFAQLRAALYDSRTDINREIKTLEGAESSVRASLPEDDGEDWPAKAAALAEKRGLLLVKQETAKAEIREDLNASLAGLHEIRANKIAAAKAIYDAAVEEANSAYTTHADELKELAARSEGEQLAEINAELQTVRADLATAEEKRRQQDRTLAARAEAEKLRKMLAEKAKARNKLNQQIEKMDALKVRVLGESAIPGVEIADGRIVVDGVDLDRLNTQRQYFLAFQIASLKQGDLGFMVCDRAESIVGAQWDEFREAAKQSGFQVMVARSEAGKPLSIEAT